MNAYERFCYQLVGKLAERQSARRGRALQLDLYKAHRSTRAAAYLATLDVTAVAAALVVLLLAELVLLRAPVLLRLTVPILVAAWAAAGVFALAPVILRNEARERARDLDAILPSGLNYMLALANAGLPPARIWGSLARAHVFGALAFEAERIHRDLSLFSMDILQALRLAQERTPSARFHEFLQGAISAFQSGVDLESYLKTKGQQYQNETMSEQRKSIDTMGLLAEAFLVVVVAAPLFLLILLTVMTLTRGNGSLAYGWGLVLVVLPLAQLVLGSVIQGMGPRGGSA